MHDFVVGLDFGGTKIVDLLREGLGLDCLTVANDVKSAGEVGYSLRGVHDEVGAAAGRAPLEEFVSGGAIGRRASRLLGAELNAAEVFALARTDLRARFLVDETPGRTGGARRQLGAAPRSGPDRGR